LLSGYKRYRGPADLRSDQAAAISPNSCLDWHCCGKITRKLRKASRRASCSSRSGGLGPQSLAEMARSAALTCAGRYSGRSSMKASNTACCQKYFRMGSDAASGMAVNLSIRFAKDRRHRHDGGGGSDESSIRVPGCGNQGHGLRIGLHEPQILSSPIKRSGAKSR